jgi:hypothetical protein
MFCHTGHELLTSDLRYRERHGPSRNAQIGDRRDWNAGFLGDVPFQIVQPCTAVV